MREKIKDNISALLKKGIEQSLYTGAQLVISSDRTDEISLTAGMTKSADAGKHTIIPGAKIHPGTLFDIASITKPLATAALIMKAVEEGVIELSQKLVSLSGIQFPSWLLGNTISDLLCHHTQLPAWLDLHGSQPRIEDHRFARNYAERQIQECMPRNDKSPWCYSDLGYILLGFILETVYDESLETLFRLKITEPLGLSREMLYCPLHHTQQKEIAATCMYSSRIIQGHPDDANARALTHCAGHAGVFASARAISAYIRTLLDKRFPCSETIIDHFIHYRNPETPFALGWDRPTSENSLSGRKPGENVIGHLGFTGCSVWIDLDTKRSVTFLTNRTHVNDDPKSLGDLRRTIYAEAWSMP